METKELKLFNLKDVEPSKSSIPIIASQLTNAVEQGYEDAVTLSAKLDYVSKVCDEARKSLKEQVIKEIESGTAFAVGYITEVAEAGVTYDYSNCNDDEYKGLLTLQEELKEAMKFREKFLKALPASGFKFVDRETGEEKTIYPPVKRSTTTAKFSLQK